MAGIRMSPANVRVLIVECAAGSCAVYRSMIDGTSGLTLPERVVRGPLGAREDRAVYLENTLEESTTLSELTRLLGGVNML